jgi:Fe(3+) dicitrate transport protein
MINKKLILGLISTIYLCEIHAQVSSANLSTSQATQEKSDTVYVIGSKEKAFYMPGSAHFIDSEELEKFKYNDINRVLDKVPGVYIQEEDGQGLRPNIGLRGAHPHRSKKVTLMEDGILVGPAPYAAPAAYYFPSTSRLSTIEVFKGPSSVQYEPNSVGGALNMVTTPLEAAPVNQIEVSSGDWTQLQAMTRGRSGANSWVLQVHQKKENLHFASRPSRVPKSFVTFGPCGMDKSPLSLFHLRV